MAKGIVNLISGLSRKGKLIICTIHQPSTQVFEKFDK
jgi:hypothetical protein